MNSGVILVGCLTLVPTLIYFKVSDMALVIGAEIANIVGISQMSPENIRLCLGFGLHYGCFI